MRIFEKMKTSYEGRVTRYAQEQKVSFQEAQRLLALIRQTGSFLSKKTQTPYEIIEVEKRSDYSLCMVNYNTRHSEAAFDPKTMQENERLAKEGKARALPRVWDLSAYIVFDHRMPNVTVEEVARKAIECVLDDTVFMKMC